VDKDRGNSFFRFEDIVSFMYPCTTHFFIHLAVVYFPAAAGEAEPLVLLQLIPTRLFYTNPQCNGFNPQMDIDDLMNSAT